MVQHFEKSLRRIRPGSADLQHREGDDQRRYFRAE
jgi:hypothetical protein